MSRDSSEDVWKIGEGVHDRVGFDGRVDEVFPTELSRADEDASHSKRHCAANVHLDVVADDRGRAGAKTQELERRAKEFRRRLPDECRLGAGRVLQRRDEGTLIQNQPVRGAVVPVARESDQGSAFEQQTEGSVHPRVAEVLSDVAHHDGVRGLIDVPDAGEILHDLRANHEVTVMKTPVQQIPPRGKRRGEDPVSARPMPIAESSAAIFERGRLVVLVTKQ